MVFLRLLWVWANMLFALNSVWIWGLWDNSIHQPYPDELFVTRTQVTSVNQGPFSGVRERTLGMRLRKHLSPCQVYYLVLATWQFGKNRVVAMQAWKIGPLAATLFTNLFPNQSYQIQKKIHVSSTRNTKISSFKAKMFKRQCTLVYSDLQQAIFFRAN